MDDKDKARMLFENGLSLGEISEILEIDSNGLGWLMIETGKKIRNMTEKEYNNYCINKMIHRYASLGITIFIWKFEDAPTQYQKLSQNGGDEDWIAFVPDSMKGEYIGFLEQGSSFGCAMVEEHKVKDGMIYIGCHS